MFKNIVNKMVLNVCEYENNGYFSEYHIKYQSINDEAIQFELRVS